MAWLTSLPAWSLVVGFLGVALIVATGSRVALRAFIPSAERDGAYSIAAPLMPTLGAAFGILMALTLAAEAASLASAQGIVSTESADADRPAWASTNPGVDSAPIQDALLSYLQATRKYEWRGNNAAEGLDPATQDAVATLERIVRDHAVLKSIGTPTSTELLASVDALQSDRRARLASASRELPGLYVVTLAVSGARADLERQCPYASRWQALRNAGRRARSCGRAEHGPAVRHRHAVARGGGCERAADRPGDKGPPGGIFPHVANECRRGF